LTGRQRAAAIRTVEEAPVIIATLGARAVAALEQGRALSMPCGAPNAYTTGRVPLY